MPTDLLEKPRHRPRVGCAAIGRFSYAELDAPVLAKRPSIRPPAPRSRASALVAKIRDASAKLEPEEGIDLIYGTLDAWLSAGDFLDVDEALDLITVRDVQPVHLLALVSITRPADARLYRRAPFLKRVRGALMETEDRELLTRLQ